MEQDIRQTLHDLVERTRSKALHSIGGIMACCRVTNQTHTLSSWEVQQVQLRVHVSQLQHSCRTLLSMTCDLAVSSTLYDVTQRKNRFRAESNNVNHFLGRIRDVYLTPKFPEQETALPRSQVITALSRIVLPFSCDGLADDRQDHLAQAIIENATFIPIDPDTKKEIPQDQLTTGQVYRETARLADADEAIQWLLNDQKPIEIIRHPIATVHSRLMLHP